MGPSDRQQADRQQADRQQADRQQAERQAWDEMAASRGADIAALEQAVQGWTSVHDVMLDTLGALSEVRMLDCGCGEGALTRAATGRGAIVVGFDLSRGMLQTALRMQGECPAPGYIECGFEKLPFPDASFDATAGTCVLHHVDLGLAAEELARIMRPGARGAFLETWQRNPLIRLARRMRGRMGVAMYGTADEQPLRPADLDTFRRAGFDVELEYPGFVFFQLLDNNVLKRRWPGVTRVLQATDRVAGKVGPVKGMGYYCIVRLTRR